MRRSSRGDSQLSSRYQRADTARSSGQRGEGAVVRSSSRPGKESSKSELQRSSSRPETSRAGSNLGAGRSGSRTDVWIELDSGERTYMVRRLATIACALADEAYCPFDVQIAHRVESCGATSSPDAAKYRLVVSKHGITIVDHDGSVQLRQPFYSIVAYTGHKDGQLVPILSVLTCESLAGTSDPVQGKTIHAFACDDEEQLRSIIDFLSSMIGLVYYS